MGTARKYTEGWTRGAQQWYWAASGGATPQSNVVDLKCYPRTITLQVVGGGFPSAAALYLKGGISTSATIYDVTNDAGILSAVPSGTVTGKTLVFTNVAAVRYVQVVASGIAACSGEAGSGWIVALA